MTVEMRIVCDNCKKKFKTKIFTKKLCPECDGDWNRLELPEQPNFNYFLIKKGDKD